MVRHWAPSPGLAFTQQLLLTGATWDMTKKPSKLYPEGYDNVPDVVKEENFDDAIPIGGGHGAGAVTAGTLGPDRLPSRRQLAPVRISAFGVQPHSGLFTRGFCVAGTQSG